MAIYDWSTTAGTNATADANINWSEGQLPSTVNDSARAMMAALASMVRDQGGYATLGGSGNTFTLALSQTMASKVPALIGFFATRANTGAVTMNVDSTGAYPLRQVSGTDLVSGQIVSGSFYIISWNSSSSEWIVLNAMNALLLTGGTMSGALTLSGAPTVDLHAATKKYVDDADALKADKTTTISAGTGLTGGGSLASNRTLGISAGGVSTTELADANVTPAKLSQPFTVGTAQATTSGTSFSFTGIPTWAKRITVMFAGVSLSGSDDILVRIGPSGGVASSGYVSSSLAFATSNAIAGSSSTSSFVIYASSSYLFSGLMTICLLDASSYTYAQSHNGKVLTSTAISGGGNVTLTGLMTQLTITRSGTSTFDAGSINILYE